LKGVFLDMKRQLLAGALLVALLFSAVSWVWTAGAQDITANGSADDIAPPESEAASEIDLARLPLGASGPGIYIQFDEPTHNLDVAHGYPVTGGAARYGWDALEPSDNDYRFDQYVLPWVQQEVARGKKVAIGFTTYNGRGADGGIKVPSWLWTSDPNVRYNNSGWYLLNYLNRTYVNKYKEFIVAFANWAAANSTVRNNLTWVEIGTGQWGENQPARKFGTDGLDWTYYKNTAKLTSATWIAHVNEVSDIYRNAFNAVGMSSLPIFTNIAPTFDAGWERDVISDYAAGIGVGLKHAGLLPDHNNAGNTYASIIKWSASTTTRVPISWEVYGEGWGQTATDWYWTVLCGLDKHPDNFLATRDLLSNPIYLPSTRIAHEYSGVTIDTTPAVWVALRETFRVGQWDVPERGNFDFWLYQTDYTGGRTVTETNRYDDVTKDVKNRLGQPVYNSALGSAKEGYTTRRTNQGDGNPYMWFKIDDGYIYGNAQVNIEVIYFDKGTDKWALRYDSLSGEKDATPSGSANAWVQKTNTSTWKTVTFNITDGRFRNFMSGAHDFRIDCLNDGDEWIHFVKASKGGASSPTPTPTATTIAPTPTPTSSPTPNPGNQVQIQLRAGPNLVAYGGPSRPIVEGLASINGFYTKVFAAIYEYDPGQNKYALVWKRYLVGAPAQFNTLTYLDPWQGYWIYVTQDCVWTWDK
jgi:hypothetical protein